MMNTRDATRDQASIDWAAWLRRWDAQQQGYLPRREDRFTVMLDALADLLPSSFLALDLCSGPGSLSQRLLARFPAAHCIALDLDPVLLAMGQAVLGDAGGRLRWVEANLVEDELGTALGEPTLDAALSTTALHWLLAEQLLGVYRQLAQLIRPGGVLLNGDNLRFAPGHPTLQGLVESWDRRDTRAAFEERGQEDWAQWWDALAQEPGAQTLIAERARRFHWRPETIEAPSVALHLAMLREVGFQEVGTIWQHGDDYVLLAIR